MNTYFVYRRIDGEWVFWMNARGKSASQLRNAVWWRNKTKVLRGDVLVTDKPLAVQLHGQAVEDRQ